MRKVIIEDEVNDYMSEIKKDLGIENLDIFSNLLGLEVYSKNKMTRTMCKGQLVDHYHGKICPARHVPRNSSKRFLGVRHLRCTRQIKSAEDSIMALHPILNLALFPGIGEKRIVRDGGVGVGFR